MTLYLCQCILESLCIMAFVNSEKCISEEFQKQVKSKKTHVNICAICLKFSVINFTIFYFSQIF